MLDVAFDLIFEQHLLGLDDKLGAKKHGSLGGGPSLVLCSKIH